MVSAIELFHGGSPHMTVGELLLPPSVTGVKTTGDWFREAAAAGRIRGPGVEALNLTGIYRPDRVYLTTVREQALTFAQQWIAPGTPLGSDLSRLPGGGLYRVVPAGDVFEPDPDNMDEAQTWWACDQARIVEVVDAAVTRLSRAEFQAAYEAEMRRAGLGVQIKPSGPRMAVPKKRRRR